MVLRERHALLRTLAEFVKSPPARNVAMSTLHYGSWRIIANAVHPSNVAAGIMGSAAQTAAKVGAEGGYANFTEASETLTAAHSFLVLFFLTSQRTADFELCSPSNPPVTSRGVEICYLSAFIIMLTTVHNPC